MNNVKPNPVPNLFIQVSSFLVDNWEVCTGKDPEKIKFVNSRLIEAWDDLYMKDSYLNCNMNRIQSLVKEELAIEEVLSEEVKERKSRKFQWIQFIFDPSGSNPQDVPKNAIVLIKQLFVKECIKCVSDKLTIENFSSKKAHRLFLKLADTFDIHPSADFNVYEPLCEEQNQALEIVWSHLCKELDHQNGPGNCIAALPSIAQPKTATQIREWRTNPIHASMLDEIKVLFVFKSELKTIPNELLDLFCNLQEIYLQFHEIEVIPNTFAMALATSQIVDLQLSCGSLKEISETFVNALAISQVKQLNLRRNQISVLPKNFGEKIGISQLVLIDLSQNLIESVLVVSLSTLKKIKISGVKLSV
jgi:hypothetical protein